MRCAALLLVALLVAVRAEGAPRVDDEYGKALQDAAWEMKCGTICPRCPPHPARCSFLVSSDWKYFYNVDGVKLKIELAESRVTLTCPKGVTLESASLPVFPIYMRVSEVTLKACPAPRASGGISRALSSLNITGGLDLEVLNLDDLPPAPRLQPDLFAGLLHLHSLNFSAEAGLVLEPPPGLLEPLMRLRLLQLTDVRMSPATMEQLPPNLEELYLVQRHPAEGSAPAPHSRNLENATFTVMRGSCSKLRWLSVSSPRGTAALPAGWLQVRGEARCPRLRELLLYSCALGGLPADALRGLTELRGLKVMNCRELRELRRGLFNDTQDLLQLVLVNNALEVLPEGIFAPLHALIELDLSGNRLGALGDGAAALVGLKSLTSLQFLVLARNPLGDTCGTSSRDTTLAASELSPLHQLEALRYLSLAHTGATWLCVDWRCDLQDLDMIDFSYNNLTVLKYSDMQWYGRVCEVNLRGNPLHDVIVTSEDYLGAPDDMPLEGRGLLKFDADLASSCHTYWAARAMREGRLHAKLIGLTCAGQPLQVAPFDDMTCAETDACPEHCTCTLRPSDDSLVLRCAARRDLPDLAPAASLARRLELRLLGARLASLPDALPASLRVLDVLLGSARVACACVGGARPVLARALVMKLQDVRCAEDGRRVHEASPCPVVAEPGLRGAWAGALGGLAVATLVLAGAWCAARRGSRLRVKAFLLARGLCTAWTHRDDDEDDCLYDVFIWFSRHDFEVVSQILRELEAGQRPLRVCVHYRDWRAGESILTQIQRSVDQSRRTLVLVSAHSARSVWARAVLREAAARALRDVTPRLVVALLQPAPPPGLDPELAHYVRANTYARWGDGAFWDRLRLALPMPPPGARPRATKTVPPSATATVPLNATATVPPSATATVPTNSTATVPSGATATVPPSATATVPLNATATVPPSATATVPTNSTATVPASGTATVPSGATVTVPPGATATVPLNATATVPPSATAMVLTNSTATVPPSATSTVPPSATATVPSGATMTVPPGATATVPPGATANVPLNATAMVLTNSTATVPSGATVTVPPSATATVPLNTTATVPPSATATVPTNSTATVPASGTATVPSGATVTVPPGATANVPLNATAMVLTNSTATVPPSATSTVPASATATVPSGATVTVPPCATATVPPSATATVPTNSTATVPPSATSTVPPSATATVPSGATVTVPPGATVTVPSGATATVPPSATATVPTNSTATVPANSTATVPANSTATVPASGTATVPPNATAAVLPP